MSRPVNKALRNAVFEFLQREYTKAGYRPISPTYSEIAKACGENPGRPEKIMRMIEMLERNELIVVERNTGSRRNIYEVIMDNAHTIKIPNDEIVADADTLIDQVNKINRELLSLVVNTKDAYEKLKNDHEYLKNKLMFIEYNGTNIHGEDMFVVNKKHNIPIMLSQIKTEFEQRENVAATKEEPNTNEGDN